MGNSSLCAIKLRPIRHLIADPCHLPFGIATGITLAQSNGLVIANAVLRKVCQIGNPDRFHGWQLWRKPEAGHMHGLPDAPQLNHLVKALLDLFIDQFPWRTEGQPDRSCGNCRILPQGVALLPFQQGFTGRIENFQRPQNTLPVSRLQTGRHGRIALGQNGMQCLRAGQPVKLAFPEGANGVGHLRHHVEPFQQGLEVKACTTNQYGTLSASSHVSDGLDGIIQPATDRIALGWIDIAIEPMLDISHLLSRRTGGENGQLVINLH